MLNGTRNTILKTKVGLMKTIRKKLSQNEQNGDENDNQNK